MEELLPYYERELVILRHYCREFAERFPKIAGRLHMAGDACDDPHIERLIQATALLTARVAKRLDNHYPEFTEGLLEVLMPHYLRAFPSCAIARLDGAGPRHGNGGDAVGIARGTELESAFGAEVRCKFRTAYELNLTPLALSGARFDPLIRAPAGAGLPPDAGAGLSMTIEARQGTLARPGLGTLRVFIDGEPSFCAALRDTLFMRVARAYVEADGGEWIALSAPPIAPVGFADDDALIPFGARSHPAYRVLTEYFAFPEKFNFFDVDLAAMLARLPEGCARATLHLAVAGLRPDSNVARMLRSLAPDRLLLGCTPVVNLFRQAGVPIAVTQTAADYAVLASATHAHAFEVYSLDAVRMLRRRESAGSVTEFRPFYSLRHGEDAGAKGHYWVMRRDEALAATSPGHEQRLTLVDADFAPLRAENSTLSLELTCSNRELPAMLGCGHPDGDVEKPACAAGRAIRFLRRPTPPCRFASAHGAHWRLISHLTLNHHSLVQEGLPAFREMLTLYDLPQSPISQRQIGGITGLAHAETALWMRGKRGASLVHGIEVRLTLDEQAFVGSGMHLFVQVIDQFLGLYVQLNSFIELVALSHKTGEELIRCKPRNGALNLA
ncbi:type VI secretion system baseplate subunit TssF [Janthinobacterium fluminis]|uniref:Type VI secretion system baseplate subunit TssF n=1 Tax=Janthinobacterium fluminis TaxID=2987524 RepID=A0ABT5JWF2_9BURK|nr:type VI secretion system baseplate subunit TssF [Janthinobacterium fluminis]MDC8757074.1 type VI secretion system baseplate subunit TssF [Janthinobacterium fluminis]